MESSEDGREDFSEFSVRVVLELGGSGVGVGLALTALALFLRPGKGCGWTATGLGGSVSYVGNTGFGLYAIWSINVGVFCG